MRWRIALLACLASIACLAGVFLGIQWRGEALRRLAAYHEQKEAADDVPSWVLGERPLTTESERDFAKRLLDDKYGAGKYPTGPGSEFSKIKKWGDRAFE
jgi:hypothetical protein